MLYFHMYWIKGIYNQKFKRKVVAAAFALVLLAEFGEFFVPKNFNIHFEIPNHLPEVEKQTVVHKKGDPQVHNIHQNHTRK